MMEKNEHSPDWWLLFGSVAMLFVVWVGAEAAQPFRPDVKPIDAYTAAILDTIHLEPTAKE